jgi:hypothetical protein
VSGGYSAVAFEAAKAAVHAGELDLQCGAEVCEAALDGVESGVGVRPLFFEATINVGLHHLELARSHGELVLETLVDPVEALVDLFEALVDVFEALVDPVEALVDVFEALVDPVEALVDLVEALVDLAEALVDLAEVLVDLAEVLVDPVEALVDLAEALIDILEADRQHGFEAVETFIDAGHVRKVITARSFGPWLSRPHSSVMGPRATTGEARALRTRRSMPPQAMI